MNLSQKMNQNSKNEHQKCIMKIILIKLAQDNNNIKQN